MNDWSTIVNAIKATVKEINYLEADTISFGYIGNCSSDGKNDDRAWTIWMVTSRSVYPTNAVPYFKTGDIKGATRALHFALDFLDANYDRYVL